MTDSNDDNIPEPLVNSLLQFDESLRTGKPADTQVMSSNIQFLEILERGQEALIELEAAIPRRSTVLPSWAPRSIGRFEIRAVLGSGGFAVVYLAFDPALNRLIALKIPRPHALVHPDLRRQFITEAQAAAKLDHPNILPVYEAGEDVDLPYIACAWCEGPTLANWILQHTTPLKPTLAAKIVRQLASAVQYSHERGILHRDIKPGNVLLFPTASGLDSTFPFTVRLSDFGLAKLMEPGQSGNLSSLLVGTPSYMAPEIVNGTGQSGDVTPDVYALGAVLYCLIIGHAPFSSATQGETLRQISDCDPVAPHIIDPSVGQELSLICMKCLQKSAQHRYATAAELGDDLDRFLNGLPVLARKTPIALRIQKWCRRNPTIAAFLVVSISLVAVLILLAVRYTTSLKDFKEQLQSTNEQLKQRVTELDSAIESANKNKAEANAHRNTAEEQVFAAELHLADSLRLTGDIRNANRILDKYDSDGPNTDDIDGHASFSWRFIKSRTIRAGTTLPNAGQSVWDMKLSPDGRKMAMCGNHGVIRIVDAHNPEQQIMEQTIASTEFNALAWSSQSPILAVSGDDGIVRICDANSLSILRQLDANPGKHAYGLAFVPGTDRLIVTGWFTDLQLWDATSGQLLKTVLTPHESVIECVDVAPDGTSFVTGGDFGQLCMWRTEDLTLAWSKQLVFSRQNGPVALAKFTPNGRFLAISALKESVFLLDAITGDQLSAWEGVDSIKALAVNNQQILCGDVTGLLSEFSVNDRDEPWRPARQWLGHDSKVSCIEPVASENSTGLATSFVSADRSGAMRLWQDKPETGSIEFEGDNKYSHRTRDGLCWKDNSTLLRRSFQGVASLTTATHQIEQFLDHESVVTCCEFAGTANCLIAGTNEGEIILVDCRTKRRTSIRAFDQVMISELSVDDAATLAVVRSSETDVAVLDLKNGAVLARWLDREDSTISPDGRWIVSGNRVKDAFEVFDGATLTLQRVLPEIDPTFGVVAFSADSKLFVTTSDDRTMSIWDTSDWTLINRTATRTNAIGAITIHPDGRTIATGDDRGFVWLWDAKAGRELVNLGTFDGHFHGLVFSPDGKSLAVCHGSLDVTIIRP